MADGTIDVVAADLLVGAGGSVTDTSRPSPILNRQSACSRTRAVDGFPVRLHLDRPMHQ